MKKLFDLKQVRLHFFLIIICNYFRGGRDKAWLVSTFFSCLVAKIIAYFVYYTYIIQRFHAFEDQDNQDY